MALGARLCVESIPIHVLHASSIDVDTQQEIKLDIPLDTCQSLAGQVSSQAASRIVDDATPVCFSVANVHFRFEQEIFALLLKNTNTNT